MIGYARVSTLDRDPALPLDALKAAGCERVFQETASGARQDPPLHRQVSRIRTAVAKEASRQFDISYLR